MFLRLAISLMAMLIGGIIGYRIAVQTMSVTQTESADCAQFIRDVTIEDGTQLQAGTTQPKTWRVKNCGTTTWTGYRLAKRYGEGGQPALRNVAVESVPVPPLKPGEEVDVTIDINVPQEPGRYRIWFDVVRPPEKRDVLWVDFVSTPNPPPVR